jgi:guanylate kinase
MIVKILSLAILTTIIASVSSLAHASKPDDNDEISLEITISNNDKASKESEHTTPQQYIIYQENANQEHFKNIILSVASPSGTYTKNVINYIAEQYPSFSKIISVSTRKPTNEERNGIEYRFISTNAYHDLAEQGRFVEQHSIDGIGRFGILKDDIEPILQTKNDAIVECGHSGALQLKNSFPNATFIAIYIMPKLLSDVRRNIESKPKIEPSVVDLKMKNILSEIASYNNYNYVISGNSIKEVSEKISAIITTAIEQRNMSVNIPKLHNKLKQENAAFEDLQRKIKTSDENIKTEVVNN